jgi:hypothetical protein
MQDIPHELFTLILHPLTIYKLAQTCSYFNNLIFDLKTIIKLNEIILSKELKFVLLNKWAKLLDNYFLPYSYRNLFDYKLVYELIKINSVYGMKLLFNNSNLNYYYLTLSELGDYFNDKFKFNKFCEKENIPNNCSNYIVNKPILILTLLFGSKDMFNILPKCVKNIGGNYIVEDVWKNKSTFGNINKFVERRLAKII